MPDTEVGSKIYLNISLMIGNTNKNIAFMLNA